MSVESSRGFPNSSALAIWAAKVVIAAVLPKFLQTSEVFSYIAVFTRNVESRHSAMFREGFGGMEHHEALTTRPTFDISDFAPNWIISRVWRIRETQTLVDARKLGVAVVVGSSER